MKKTILAAALTSLLVGTTAHAATVYENENGDSMKVYGGMEVGGWVSADHQGDGDSYVDDSFMTLGVKGQTGDFYGKFELDAERTPWTKDNKFQLVIDKAYVGYKVADGHSVEFGRTDTAYDHYDALGDFSINEAAEVSEAGDQDNTVKYRGQVGKVKFGISHSTEGWDGDTDADGKPFPYTYTTDSRHGAVTNGYVGYFDSAFTVVAGAETVDERGEIFSLHGTADLGKVNLGGIVSSSKSDAEDNDQMTYVASVSYEINDKLKAVSTYSVVDHDKEARDDDWATAGLEYQYAKNVKLTGEIVTGGENDTYGYLKAFYWF